MGEHASGFVLVVDPAEELGVEPQLGKQRDVGGTVAESVDLPPNRRNVSDLSKLYSGPKVSAIHRCPRVILSMISS